MALIKQTSKIRDGEALYDVAHRDHLKGKIPFITVGFEGSGGDFIVANGSTVAEEVINQAINLAHANGGGEVLLLTGTYLISNPVIIKDGVNLLGEGAGTTIKCIPNSPLVFDLVCNYTYYMKTYIDSNYDTNLTREKGICVRDLTIDGDRANQSNGNSAIWGLVLHYVDFPRVENVIIKNTIARGMYLLQAKGAIIEGCRLENSTVTTTAGGSISISDSEHITLRNNTITGLDASTMPYRGIYCYNCTYVSVIGNVVRFCSTGIETRNTKRYTITTNRVFECGRGIVCSLDEYGTVSNNTIDNISVGSGISLSTNSYMSVHDNKMNNIKQYGIHLTSTHYSMVTANFIEDVSVEGNGLYHGIHVNTGTRVNIHNNMVRSYTPAVKPNYALYINSGTTCTAKNNDFLDAGVNASASVTGTNNLVTGNRYATGVLD